MATDTNSRIHFHETNRNKRILLVLFSVHDIQTNLLITSCKALQFHVETTNHLPTIEKLIKSDFYEMILVDTRKETNSTVVNVLKVLTRYTSRSYLIVLWSSRPDINPRSKLEFLLSLLQTGVDRILQESTDIIVYIIQLLSIREIDLKRKQNSQLTSAISAVLNQWPQAIGVVNEDFDLLYQNNRTQNHRELVIGENIFVKYGGSHSTLGQRMKQQMIKTRRPWKWKSKENESSSMIFIVSMYVNTFDSFFIEIFVVKPLDKTSVSTHSFQSIANDRSHSSLIKTRLTHPNRSHRSNRLSNHRILNKRYIELLRNANDEKDIRSIIQKIAVQFNITKDIRTIDELIQLLRENHVDVSNFDQQKRERLISSNYLTDLSNEIRNELNQWNTWDFDLVRSMNVMNTYHSIIFGEYLDQT